jgi:glycine hydroxymethyltransferase
MKNIEKLDKNIYNIINKEISRQSLGLNLIASENYVSNYVMESTGSLFTNKYAEGYPDHRYYSGCEEHDKIEALAIEYAKKLFNAEHANVQPHSGSNANLAVYHAFLKPNDTILSMHLDHGGHLTHGAKVSCVGQLYNIVSYGVTKKYETIDYVHINKLASVHKPKIIIAGASAYPRVIDFKAFSKIAKQHNALLMVDMSHISGLIAAKQHPSPFPFADIVTSTTHKTLRGPRGGIILCKEKYKDAIDKSVFPGLQGGPLMNHVLSKAICFKEAMLPSFVEYQKQVIKNAKVLALKLKTEGFELVSNGTDNHLMLVKVDHLGLNGKECQEKLENIDIFVNKNKIPFDKKTALTTSGIRLGTAALTSLGMKEINIEEVGQIIADCLLDREKSDILKLRVHKISAPFTYKGW